MILEESNAFGHLPRFVLIGTVHGSFSDCSNDIPGIFVKTDHLSILEFLQREAYGRGLLRIYHRAMVLSSTSTFIPK